MLLRHAHTWRRVEAALRRADAHLLVGSLLVAASLWLFLELTDEMGDPETLSMEERVLLALRTQGRPLGPRWLHELARDITALGSFGVVSLVVMACVGLLALERRWRAAALVTVSVGTGTALTSQLKIIFERARPDVVGHLVDVTSFSFPSGHAAVSAVTYVTLGALATQLASRNVARAYLLALSVTVAGLVGLSRVYLGVHYPTDVLAGWSFGFGWAILCLMVTRALVRYGVVSRGNEELESREGA